MGHNETVASIAKFVDKRRAFIELCVGPALGRVIELDPRTAAFPLKPLGNNSNVNYGADFIRLLGVPIDRAFHEKATTEGRSFHGVTALVYCDQTDEEFQRATQGLSTHTARSRALISFFLAGELVPIIRFAWYAERKGAAEFLAPRSLRGLPKRQPDDPVNPTFLEKVHVTAETDNLFHYYLGILQAAQGEVDAAFRIARLFTLLEALAAPISSSLSRDGEKVGSRTGIRVLLGYYVEFDIPIFTVDDVTIYEFDHVELAGQLRDRLFHGGSNLKEEDVKDAVKPGVQLLNTNANMIAHALRRDCERELVGYAERTGRAWRSRHGETYPMPQRLAPDQLKNLSRLHVTGSLEPTGGIGSIYVKVTGQAAGLVRLKLSL